MGLRKKPMKAMARFFHFSRRKKLGCNSDSRPLVKRVPPCPSIEEDRIQACIQPVDANSSISTPADLLDGAPCAQTAPEESTPELCVPARAVKKTSTAPMPEEIPIRDSMSRGPSLRRSLSCKKSMDRPREYSKMPPLPAVPCDQDKTSLGLKQKFRTWPNCHQSHGYPSSSDPMPDFLSSKLSPPSFHSRRNVEKGGALQDTPIIDASTNAASSQERKNRAPTIENEVKGTTPLSSMRSIQAFKGLSITPCSPSDFKDQALIRKAPKRRSLSAVFFNATRPTSSIQAGDEGTVASSFPRSPGLSLSPTSCNPVASSDHHALLDVAPIVETASEHPLVGNQENVASRPPSQDVQFDSRIPKDTSLSLFSDPSSARQPVPEKFSPREVPPLPGKEGQTSLLPSQTLREIQSLNDLPSVETIDVAPSMLESVLRCHKRSGSLGDVPFDETLAESMSDCFNPSQQHYSTSPSEKSIRNTPQEPTIMRTTNTMTCEPSMKSGVEETREQTNPSRIEDAAISSDDIGAPKNLGWDWVRKPGESLILPDHGRVKNALPSVSLPDGALEPLLSSSQIENATTFPEQQFLHLDFAVGREIELQTSTPNNDQDLITSPFNWRDTLLKDSEALDALPARNTSQKVITSTPTADTTPSSIPLLTANQRGKQPLRCSSKLDEPPPLDQLKEMMRRDLRRFAQTSQPQHCISQDIRHALVRTRTTPAPSSPMPSLEAMREAMSKSTSSASASPIYVRSARLAVEKHPQTGSRFTEQFNAPPLSRVPTTSKHSLTRHEDPELRLHPLYCSGSSSKHSFHPASANRSSAHNLSPTSKSRISASAPSWDLYSASHAHREFSAVNVSIMSKTHATAAEERERRMKLRESSMDVHCVNYARTGLPRWGHDEVQRMRQNRMAEVGK